MGWNKKSRTTRSSSSPQFSEVWIDGWNRIIFSNKKNYKLQRPNFFQKLISSLSETFTFLKCSTSDQYFHQTYRSRWFVWLGYKSFQQEHVTKRKLEHMSKKNPNMTYFGYLRDHVLWAASSTCANAVMVFSTHIYES